MATATSGELTTTTKTATKARTAALPGRQAAWECPGCGEYNGGRQPSCLACFVEHRPGLQDQERMILWLLEPDRETQGMWSTLRDDDPPPGDLWLQERICTVLNVRGGEMQISTSKGYVSWQVDEGDPLVWFCDQIQAAKRPPQLDGHDLVVGVRLLWGIPRPGEAKGASADDVPAELSVPLVSIEALHASYSGDIILNEGTIKPPVAIDDQLWVSVGVMNDYAGQSGERSTFLQVYEVIPREQWQGAAACAKKITDEMRKKPEGPYHRLRVNHGEDEYVLCGPERLVDTRGMLDTLANLDAAAETTEPETTEPKKKRSARKKTPAAESNGSMETLLQAGTRLDIRMSYIVPSPFQPRTVFDQETLQQLGESIKAHGQTSDCLVRQIGKNKFELIGGERRFRACQLMKKKTLACKVIVADDKKARELAVFDNLDREDLNEIDRIRAYQGLLDEGVYATQQELADVIGMKPASLSNLLRILKLPEKWLDYISQEKLPITHARYVVPFADRPTVLKDLESRLKHDVGHVDSWKWAIRNAVEECSRPLSGEFWGKRPGYQYYGHHKVRLTKKEREREDLDVVDVKGIGKRAFNVDLWEELQTAGEERAAKRAGGKSKASANGTQETAADVAAKEAKRKEQFAKKLWIYKIGWMQRKLADVIRTQEPFAGGADQQRILSLLLYFSEHTTGGADICVTEALQQAGVKQPKRRIDEWCEIVQGDCRQLWEAARTAAVEWVQQNPFSYHGNVSDRTIEAMCVSFDVDAKRDWRLEQDYLELLSKDQLSDLAAEWKVTKNASWQSFGEGGKRADMIRALMSAGDKPKSVPCPKALAGAKRPANFRF